MHRPVVGVPLTPVVRHPCLAPSVRLASLAPSGRWRLTYYRCPPLPSRAQPFLSGSQGRASSPRAHIGVQLAPFVRLSIPVPPDLITWRTAVHVLLGDNVQLRAVVVVRQLSMIFI
jgi:hypothetical protein